MRKFIFLAVAMPAFVHAQVNQVLQASQFGGITNVSYNPAIAENRFALDINLLSLSAGIDNNYLGARSAAFANHSIFSDPNLQTDNLTERLNGNAKALFAGLQVQGPLSFLYCWGQDRKNAIAFSWHLNAIADVDGVSEKLARMAYYGLGTTANAVTPFNYQALSNSNLSAKLLAWSDFGITYSRVVYDEGPHMFKVGATLKALVGMAGGYIYSNNLSYRFRNYDTLDITHSDLSYGHSQIFSQGNFNLSSLAGQFSLPSAGADLGVIYEWRPDKEAFASFNNFGGLYRDDVNKYKLAAGLSVVDIGRLRFARPQDVRDYYLNVQGWDLQGAHIHDVASFDQALYNQGADFKTGTSGSFKIWLPARLNAFVDYEIWKGLGLNLSGTISPVLASGRNQVHYPSSAMLTPRYDWKWIGAYLPFETDEYGNFMAGAGLRLGPLFISSSDIITVFASRFTFNANIQAGLKISIPDIASLTKEKGCTRNFNNKLF